MASLQWREWATDPEQLRRLHLLERVPLFAGLSRRQLGKLLVKLFEKEYAPGETVFLEGEPGKALFIVLDGRVSIFHAGAGTEERVATLAAGGYFGELALIDDLPRSASARADEQSALLILYKSHFDDLIEGHSAIAIRVMGNLLKTLTGYVRAAHARGATPGSPLPGTVTDLGQAETPPEKPDR
jgi:CRP-like cAMP-binding protein